METQIEINETQSAATRNRNGKKALVQAAKEQEEREAPKKSMDEKSKAMFAEREAKEKEKIESLQKAEAEAEAIFTRMAQKNEQSKNIAANKEQAEADKGDLRQAIKYILASEDKDERESWVSNALKCDMATMEAEIVEATKKEIIAKEVHKNANDYLKALKEVISEKMDMASEEEKMPLLQMMMGEA